MIDSVIGFLYLLSAIEAKTKCTFNFLRIFVILLIQIFIKNSLRRPFWFVIIPIRFLVNNLLILIGIFLSINSQSLEEVANTFPDFVLMIVSSKSNKAYEEYKSKGFSFFTRIDKEDKPFDPENPDTNDVEQLQNGLTSASVRKRQNGTGLH